jgi:hypothetical protein
MEDRLGEGRDLSGGRCYCIPDKNNEGLSQDYESNWKGAIEARINVIWSFWEMEACNTRSMELKQKK